MLAKFEKKIADFLQQAEFLDQPDKVLLAISGGPDSIALLHVMCVLKNEDLLKAELFCAHLNHQLRGADADIDECFVIEQASKLNLPITTKRLNVQRYAFNNKLSIETAARKVRIKFLVDVARANHCKWIATGHQKNDNAETIVHRLIRGTGFRGLAGIWPIKSFDRTAKFIRPLLCVTRNEIIRYLRERNLNWRQDRTNIDCKYRRNYIRHKLLTAVQQDCTEPIQEQLSELAESAQRFHRLICGRAEKLWTAVSRRDGNKVILHVAGFSSEPEPVQLELIRRSLATIGGGEKGMTRQHYRKILQLAQRNSNSNSKKIQLPGRLTVIYEYGNLIFVRFEQEDSYDKQLSNAVELTVPGRTEFGRYLIEATLCGYKQSDFEKFKVAKNNSIECFDLEKVKPPLFVRFRRQGDSFWPLGMPKEKKLGKFLTAAHVQRKDRHNALIIADKEKIIWVWPIRISEQVKISSETKQVLQLCISNHTQYR
jgi:tRNA(Ile)-lysidine synthase